MKEIQLFINSVLFQIIKADKVWRALFLVYILGFINILAVHGELGSEGEIAVQESLIAETMSSINTTEIILNAIDDAYVMENFVNENNGTATKVMIKNDSRKVGLVKFDLNSLSGQISSAILQLNGTNDASGGNLSVYSVIDDTWSESTVTYSNKPTKGSFLGSGPLDVSGTVYNIDISTYVFGEELGDKIVSLWLNDNQNIGSRYDFASKEAEGNLGPKLILQMNEKVEYTLVTNSTNGSVNPSGGTYEEGTIVTLTAIPDAGFEFSSWSGDISGTVNPVGITMSSDKLITANFVEAEEPILNTLTTTINGNGSVIPASGSMFQEDSVVTLIATPEIGWIFTGWAGDENCTCANTTIKMNDNKNVIATFTKLPTSSGPVITTLITSHDAFVRNGIYKRDNYGFNTELEINQSTDYSNKRFSYLQFDLSNIGTVTSAILELKNIGNSKLTDVYSVPNDNWKEDSITWHIKPSLGSVQATYNFGGTGFYRADVTQYVAKQADGDNVVSLALKGQSSSLMTISSKEGIYAPRLIISHDGIPKSVEEIELLNKPNVFTYPNPSTGKVIININNVRFNTGIVKIINTNGVVLKSYNINSTVTLLDLSHLNKGLYVILVSFNNNTTSEILLIK